MPNDSEAIALLERQLKRERMARKEAERLLEEKSQALFDASEEQKTLMRRLLRAQQMESIGRLSGVIAHDFNNMIAVMKGLSEILAEDLETGSELHGHAEMLLKAAEQSEALIARIHDYGTRTQSQMKPLDVAISLEENVAMLQGTLPANLMLHYAGGQQGLWVEGNGTQLAELWMNVLKNAIEACGARPESTVRVTSTACKGYDLGKLSRDVPALFRKNQVNIGRTGRAVFVEPCVHIAIEDNGNGIAQDVMQHIFKPYFSTKSDDATSGLGMFGAEGVLGAHSGGMRLMSRENEGTYTEIVLPLLQEKRTTRRANKALRILVVDDEVIVATVLCKQLERMGHQATHMDKPIEALAHLQAQPEAYDLVITDQIMPKMKGTELAEALAELLPDLPIFLYSGFLDEEEGALNVAAHLHTVLKKPVDLALLKDALARL